MKPIFAPTRRTALRQAARLSARHGANCGTILLLLAACFMANLLLPAADAFASTERRLNKLEKEMAEQKEETELLKLQVEQIKSSAPIGSTYQGQSVPGGTGGSVNPRDITFP